MFDYVKAIEKLRQELWDAQNNLKMTETRMQEIRKDGDRQRGQVYELLYGTSTKE